MATTARGITYPASTDDVRPWEDMQSLAETADDALDDLEVQVGSVLARGNRATSKTGITTETAFFRFDDVPVLSGHAITMELSGVSLQPASDASTQVGAIRVRYTTDGSTPTTSSTELSIHRVACPTTANAPYFSFVATYYPPSDMNLSVVWTVSREAGTVNQQAAPSVGGMQFQIVDRGAAPSASGTSI